MAQWKDALGMARGLGLARTGHPVHVRFAVVVVMNKGQVISPFKVGNSRKIVFVIKMRCLDPSHSSCFFTQGITNT